MSSDKNEENDVKRKSNAYCCVPQCSGRYDGKNVSFHLFPKNPVMRNKWIQAFKIGKNVSPYMRVCSQHFSDTDFFFNKSVPCKRYALKRNAIPSQNLPKRTHDSKVNEDLIHRRNMRLIKRQELKATNKIPEKELDNHDNELLDNAPHTQEDIEIAQTLLELSSARSSVTPKTFEDKGVQVNTYEDIPAFDISDVINTDSKLRIMTGISSFLVLKVFLSSLQPLIETKKINLHKIILLTFMRIKLDIPFAALSVLFNVSSTTVQKYFQICISKLAVLSKHIIRFPPKEEIKKNMPLCFKKYPDCRIVLDCSEIEIQKSKCLKCKIKTYSYYKGRQTIKYLFGVSPSGLITFLSRPYGGRASDKVIFNKENLIAKLSAGDAIMVDKGFLIEKECKEKNIKLIRPPFLRKKKTIF